VKLTALRTSLKDLPGIPLDADSPVFNEPWEARAFAMTLTLHERGVFTWPQWAEALSRQIDIARAAGDEDLGDTYYQHWLRALESLVQDLPP
jgi:nitrile hydratase accessory protein